MPTAKRGKLGGLSIDGASAGENRYIVDGAETHQPAERHAGQGRAVSDFIEEVQVKSSGYTAEYGGATGGVINVVTKSGTNNWRGTALMYYESDALRGDTIDGFDQPEDAPPEPDELRTSPRRSPTTATTTAASSRASRSAARSSATAPGSTSATTRPSRATSARSTLRANGQDVTTKQEAAAALPHGQQHDADRLEPAHPRGLQQQLEQDRRRAGEPDGHRPGRHQLRHGQHLPELALSGQADWVVTPSFYVGGRVGYYFSDNNSFGIPAVDRYIFPSRPTSAIAGVPAEPAVRATGYSSVPTNTATTFDKQKRLSFQVDGTWYGNFGGQHTIKGGLQVDKLGNDVLSGEQGNLLRFYWDRDARPARPRHLRLLPRPHQRRDPAARLHHRG